MTTFRVEELVIRRGARPVSCPSTKVLGSSCVVDRDAEPLGYFDAHGCFWSYSDVLAAGPRRPRSISSGMTDSRDDAFVVTARCSEPSPPRWMPVTSDDVHAVINWSMRSTVEDIDTLDTHPVLVAVMGEKEAVIQLGMSWTRRLATRCVQRIIAAQ